MDWEEVKIPGPGPQMLWPMAWSLLPLVGGMLLLLQGKGLLATGFLAFGVMLSLIAVWIGTSAMPGRIDMLTLLVSPFMAFALLFQPHEIIQVLLALIPWIINYRTASFLSALSGTAYRCEWDPKSPLPDVEGATYMHRKWAARPLFRIGTNIVRGVRTDSQIMLEADAPITFTFSEE